MDFVFPEPEPEQEFQEYTMSFDDIVKLDAFMDEVVDAVHSMMQMPAKEMVRIYLSAMEGESQDEHDYEIVKSLIFLGWVKLMEEVEMDRSLANGDFINPEDEDDDDEEED